MYEYLFVEHLDSSIDNLFTSEPVAYRALPVPG
jgi:hypothetical protein